MAKTSGTSGQGISGQPSNSTSEVDALRAERDALLQNDIDTWLTRVRSDSAAYSDFEKSISWRVTKPIRWAGVFVRKVRSDGLGEALALALSAVSRRITRR